MLGTALFALSAAWIGRANHKKAHKIEQGNEWLGAVTAQTSKEVTTINGRGSAAEQIEASTARDEEQDKTANAVSNPAGETP